jgi:hypothetical protein
MANEAGFGVVGSAPTPAQKPTTRRTLVAATSDDRCPETAVGSSKGTSEESGLHFNERVLHSYDEKPTFQAESLVAGNLLAGSNLQ